MLYLSIYMIISSLTVTYLLDGLIVVSIEELEAQQSKGYGSWLDRDVRSIKCKEYRMARSAPPRPPNDIVGSHAIICRFLAVQVLLNTAVYTSVKTT